MQKDTGIFVAGIGPFSALRWFAPLACWALAGPLMGAPGAEVTAATFSSSEDGTRVVIAVSAAFQFTSGQLENPERIFFDFIGAKSRIVKDGTRTIAVGDALVEQIRVGDARPGITRVVVDLKRPVDFGVHELSNPNRLVIDLTAKAPLPSMTTIAPIPPPPPPTDVVETAAVPGPVVPESEPANPGVETPVTGNPAPAENREAEPAIAAEKPEEPAIPVLKPKYKLTILEGASTSKRAKKGRVSSQAVVKVTDQNDVPVAGVAVAFTIPQMAGGASFASGGATSLVTTNAAGVASSGTYTAPLGATFNISVAASAPGGLVTAAVPISTAAALAGAGAMAGAGAAAAGAGATGIGISTGVLVTIVAGVGAAAAAGVVAARAAGKSNPAAPGITGTIGTAGVPTFNHP